MAKELWVWTGYFAVSSTELEMSRDHNERNPVIFASDTSKHQKLIWNHFTNDLSIKVCLSLLKLPTIETKDDIQLFTSRNFDPLCTQILACLLIASGLRTLAAVYHTLQSINYAPLHFSQLTADSNVMYRIYPMNKEKGDAGQLWQDKLAIIISIEIFLYLPKKGESFTPKISFLGPKNLLFAKKTHFLAPQVL